MGTRKFKIGDKVLAQWRDCGEVAEEGIITELADRDGHFIVTYIKRKDWDFFAEDEMDLLPLQDPYQVGGNHYSKHSIEPFDIMKDWKLGAVRLKVLKYLLRAPEKNGKQDIEKAKGCLQYLLDNYETLEEKGIL